MSSKNRVLLTAMATIIGGFSLWLFTKITRDILFDGLTFCTSSNLDLLFGSVTLFTAAATAGFMTSLIVVRNNHLPHILLSVFIAAKMSFIITCDYWNNAVLFDTFINVALILGLWLGNYGARKFPLAPV